MNVLILTSINPVLAGDVYTKATKELKIPDNVGFLCYPFFAEMKCQMENKPFLPVFFAMLKEAEKVKMNKKLFNKEINIVIGNCYKSQEFDIIVAVDDMNRVSDDPEEEDLAFDTYLTTVQEHEELDTFRAKVDAFNLYNLEDAEIILPTVKHALLFIEGVIKNGNTIK